MACQEASSSLLPTPVAQLVPLAADVAAAGAEGGEGEGAGRKPGGRSSLVTCSDPKTLLHGSRTTPQRQKNIYIHNIYTKKKKYIYIYIYIYILRLTAVTPQGKERYLREVL